MKILLTLTVLSVFTTVAAQSASACECNRPTICEAFSAATKVFIGKLESSPGAKKGFLGTTSATFSVERTFKGETNPFESVTMRVSDCAVPLMIGEKYFVYMDNEGLNRYCSRTSYLRGAEADIEFAKNALPDKPVFYINGLIADHNLTKSERINDIAITFNGKTEKISIGDDRQFSYKASEEGTYQVRFSVPTSASVLMHGYRGYFESTAPLPFNSSKNLYIYDVRFRPNACDFREIQIWPTVTK